MTAGQYSGIVTFQWVLRTAADLSPAEQHQRQYHNGEHFRTVYSKNAHRDMASFDC
jgi:hypothetical protein